MSHVLTESEQVKLSLFGLCNEAKEGASGGYLVVRLRDILGKTKYFHLVRGVDYVKPQNVMRYVYNCYLSVNGLSMK
jgi:hypothetical protein